MVVSSLKILSLLLGILLLANACRRLPKPTDPEPLQPPPQAAIADLATQADSSNGSSEAFIAFRQWTYKTSKIGEPLAIFGEPQTDGRQSLSCKDDKVISLGQASQITLRPK